MIIDHNRSLPKSGSPHLSTPNKSPSPLPHKPTPQQTAKSQQVHTHQSDESTTDTIKTVTTPSDPLLTMVHQSIHTSDDDASDISMKYHLRCDYHMDPDGTLVAQPKKYISKILDSFHQMFPGESLPQVKSPLDKIDHPELDNSELASDDLITKFMCMVGQLQ